MSDTLSSAIVSAVPATLITIIIFFMLLSARQSSKAAERAARPQMELTFAALAEFMLRSARQASKAAERTARPQTEPTADALASLRQGCQRLNMLMIENVDYFHENPDRPTGPIVLENGRPNPDRRLYISLIFFGMVEEVVTVRKRGVASASDVEGYERFIAAVMKMPVVQEFWHHSRIGYPEHVRAYLDPLAVPARTGSA